MPNINDLDRRIKERLEVSEESRRLRQNHFQETTKEMQDRYARYTAIADRLMKELIRPRVDKLKQYFDNAVFPEADNSRHTCVCEFTQCPRFPATVRLELAVTRDGDATTVIVQSKAEMVPVLARLEGLDRLCMPLGAVQEDKIAAWVDDKIVCFVDAYLRLETANPSQPDNVVLDPVCGMSVNKNQPAASTTHQGQAYYFCREECRLRFAENPERYLPIKGRA
jgi:YHS domain-containing protein